MDGDTLSKNIEQMKVSIHRSVGESYLINQDEEGSKKRWDSVDLRSVSSVKKKEEGKVK